MYLTWSVAMMVSRCLKSANFRQAYKIHRRKCKEYSFRVPSETGNSRLLPVLCSVKNIIRDEKKKKNDKAVCCQNCAVIITEKKKKKNSLPWLRLSSEAVKICHAHISVAAAHKRRVWCLVTAKGLNSTSLLDSVSNRSYKSVEAFPVKTIEKERTRKCKRMYNK